MVAFAHVKHSDGGTSLVCERCGAVVAWDRQGIHTGHHAEQDELAAAVAAHARALGAAKTVSVPVLRDA